MEDLKNEWDIDHLIKQQQLDLMIQRVESLYHQDKKILFHLKNAKQFLKNNEPDMAVITLENILLDKNVSPSLGDAHRNIMEEARALGLKFISQDLEFRGGSVWTAAPFFRGFVESGACTKVTKRTAKRIHGPNVRLRLDGPRANRNGRADDADSADAHEPHGAQLERALFARDRPLSANSGFQIRRFWAAAATGSGQRAP